MLRLPVILLQFQAHLAHSLRTFAWLDLVCLLTLRSRFGTHLLPHLLLATLALLLEPLDDVDGTATFGDHVRVGGADRVGLFVIVEAIVPAEGAEEEGGAASRE